MSFPLFKLPPGPSFILSQVLSWKFASFTASVYFICIGNEVLDIKVPVWVVISSSILAFPCILVARAQHRYWRDGKKAASLGARLAPTVPTRLPAGVDLVTAWMEVFRTGYIGRCIYPHLALRNPIYFLAGDVVVDWLAEGGQTVDMRTLWASRVSSCSCMLFTFELAQDNSRS